jgi:hypothetical protein
MTSGSISGPTFIFNQTPAINNVGIFLQPVSTLTDAGGMVALGTGSLAGFCLTDDCRAVATGGFDEVLRGSLQGTPMASGVPEISTLPALGLGLAGVVLMKLRVRTRRQE